MGNAGPFRAEGGVNRQLRPVVPRVELTPQRAHPLRRQGVARLGPGVGAPLEVREHRLPEERRPHHVVKIVQKPFLLRIRPASPQQVSQQQGLVGGGGDLRKQDRVVGVDLGLGGVGVPRVQGVPHLVDQREDIPQGAVVVQKHVGVRPVGAPGIGALALSPVLPDVYPSLREAPFQVGDVVRPQRLQRPNRQIAGILVEDVGKGLVRQGDVEVVIMHGVEPEGAPAQRDAAVHEGREADGGIHHVIVDTRRNVVTEQRHLQSVPVAPCIGIEDVALHGARVKRADDVAERPIGLVDALEGGLAHRPVRGAAQPVVALLGELHQAALLVPDVGKLQVRVGQEGKGVLRDGGELPRPGQEPLLRRGEDVRPLPEDLGEVKVVEPQPLVLRNPTPQIGLGDRKDLGAKEGTDGPVPRRQGLDAGGHLHGPRDAQVLVALHIGVDVELPQLQRHGLLRLQIGQKRGRPLPKAPRVVCKGLDPGLQSGKGGLPCLGGGIDGLQIPTVALRDLRALRDGACSRRLRPVEQRRIEFEFEIKVG